MRGSQDDDEIWQHLKREVQPLRRVKKNIKIKKVKATAGVIRDRLPTLPNTADTAPKKWQRLPVNLKIKTETIIPAPHGIAEDKVSPLRSGRAVVDATLDLHGLTQAEAHQELDYFLKKQLKRGARCLLIITGKGRDNAGVLRLALPKWLMAGAFARHILTIHPAHQKHGGDGATYVLLRKSGLKN